MRTVGPQSATAVPWPLLHHFRLPSERPGQSLWPTLNFPSWRLKVDRLLTYPFVHSFTHLPTHACMHLFTHPSLFQLYCQRDKDPLHGAEGLCSGRNADPHRLPISLV